ncbi:MAG: transglycosylase [Alteromonadaceae bacterium]|nr:MAG: transglycosylase [Alteromonadaceae bacterium]
MKKVSMVMSTLALLGSSYLVSSCFLISSVIADEFDDAFAEMDRQIASNEKTKQELTLSPSGKVDCNRKELSEYEQWKCLQEKEYEAYKLAYFEALNDYKDSIGKYWDKVEVTDKKNWVEYSDDLQTKRVVDYERNEIRISVIDPAQGNEAIQKLIDANLKHMLEKTPNTARQADPVLKSVGSTQAANDKQSKTSMLSELLNNQNQSLNAKVAELRKTAVITRGVTSNNQSVDKTTPIVVTIKLPKNSLGRRAAKYEDMVKQNASKNKLDPSLVYAIMHTESAFNPMARSAVPAYGLMQIVPESAGRDVSMRLYKKDQIFPAAYLYDASNNVEAGSTYLNILYYSYLKGVKDPLSRKYCVIAAYNTGAGNVAKAFIGSRKLRKALPKINSMTPEQVYDVLIDKLPYEETQEYLKRVVKRQKLYVSA